VTWPRLVVLVNPGARDGRAPARLARALVAAGLSHSADIVPVHSRGEARAIVRGLAADAIPVAAGGDGTVNLVAGAMWEERCNRPMGVLPLGTGNAFAAPLGLGRLSRAVAALHGNVERAIDLLVTTHPGAPVATVSLSAGFESRFLRGAAPLRTWRRWVAILRGAAQAALGRTTGIALETDGEQLVMVDEAVYNVGLYNSPCYGFGWRMWPDADASDGFAEAVVCCSARRYWRVLRRGLATARPLDGDPRVRRWSTARFESAEPLQVDGEVVPGARFEVRVEPRALRVLVPAPIKPPHSTREGGSS
jgi:diacylglycerol kinase (ATP)